MGGEIDRYIIIRKWRQMPNVAGEVPATPKKGKTRHVLSK
jgi:hypothetical protein